MTTTLSRRIRRIGLLPTTFKTYKEERLTKKDDGSEEIVTITKKTPIRHSRSMSADERAAIADKFRTEARAARRAKK